MSLAIFYALGACKVSPLRFYFLIATIDILIKHVLHIAEKTL
jgi:hypothetical protein